MELIAQKPMYRGHGLLLQPGERFEETRKDVAAELLRSGRATLVEYERKLATPAKIGLISCIMPTKNRREFAPRAIQCFQAQSYELRELIVLDNGDPIADLMPKDSKIRYIRLASKQPTGQLRNLCCQLATGEFIAHWDDDDWSHPRRLEEQIAILGDKAVTGYQKIMFHGPGDEVLRYSGGQEYAVGTSLLYRRSWWESHRFPAQQIGEDSSFVTQARGSIVVTDGTGRMVASTHSTNTSPRMTRNQEWTVLSLADLPEGYQI